MLKMIRFLRSRMYRNAKILGDVQAVMTGQIGNRVGRRVAGKYSGRGMGRMFR